MVLDAMLARSRRQHDERVHAAWITAQLTAYAPAKAKDFVPLDKLLMQKAARRQTWQEIKVAVMLSIPRA